MESSFHYLAFLAQYHPNTPFNAWRRAENMCNILPMPTLALVDDDVNIQTSLSMALELEGFDVVTYQDGVAALEGLTSKPVDLVVMDVKMPKMDGVETLRRLRTTSAVPVILLTSKNEEADELAGLANGADDYITKPFSQALLLQRIRALLRRQALAKIGSTAAAPTANSNEQVLIVGPLWLDQARYICKINNKPVNLTVTEFMLLACLVQEPGAVKTRADLIKATYEEEQTIDDRLIDSHIKRIRKKLRDLDPENDMIETLYGVGYRCKIS